MMLRLSPHSLKTRLSASLSQQTSLLKGTGLLKSSCMVTEATATNCSDPSSSSWSMSPARIESE